MWSSPHRGVFVVSTGWNFSGRPCLGGGAVGLDGWKIHVETATSIVGKAQDDVDRLEGEETALTGSFTEAATARDHIDIG